MSPFLFIIMAEALSRYIIKMHSFGLWKGIQIENIDMAVTHSLFADDTNLFEVATLEEANQIKDVLNKYSLASRQ